MNNFERRSGGMNQNASTSLANGTLQQSTTSRSTSIRIRIRPHAPLPTQPLLIPCIEQTTISAFKARITTLINAKSDTHFDPRNVRLEIDGYAIADDCMIGEIVRETDVVEVHWEGKNAIEKPDQALKAKVHARSEASYSSSSSSSASSSSEDSSSESSESDSSSSSSSSDEGEGQSRGTATRTNGSVGWVPPGQGSIRTQRNNTRKRKRARAEFDAEREKRLIETIKRVGKQALTELTDKEAEERENFGIDKEGDRATLSNFQNKINAPLNVDKIVTLPPGGGSLGLPTADLSMNSTMGQSSPSSQRAGKAKQYREILPPSQRQDPVPACIRLTRVDCDDCATPWPAEESGVVMTSEEGEDADGGDIAIANADALYLAFKAQGQEALKKMRAAEEKKEEERTSTDGSAADEFLQQVAMGLPVTFGKPTGWDGNEILASKGLADKVPTNGHQESSPTLDYGNPEGEEKTESVAETLNRLRKLRDEARVQSSQPKMDLLSIRQAALQSIKKKVPS